MSLLLQLVAGCGGDTPSTPPPAIAVSLIPSTLTIIGLGQSGSLQATVSGGSAGGATIAWRSSDTSVVQVTASGNSATLQSRGRGNATITASVNGATASAAVAVQADLRGIVVPESAVTLTTGERQTLIATANADPGVVVTYTWSSSATGVAVVSASGANAEVTAVSAGTSQIVVEGRSQFGETRRDTITVTAANFSASLQPSTLVLKGSEARRIAVVLTDARGQVRRPASISLTSSSPDVVSATPVAGTSEFTVRGMTIGAANISVTTDLSHPALILPVRVDPCVRTGDVLQWPVCGDDRGSVSQDYAEFGAVSVGTPAHHTGLDITAPEDEPVFAAAAGVVVLIQVLDAQGCGSTPSSCRDRGLGHSVVVKHTLAGRTMYTQYSHLRSIGAELLAYCPQLGAAGERCSVSIPIAAGTFLGRVGRSGFGDIAQLPTARLHFEVKDRGVLHNPRAAGADTPENEGNCAVGQCTWEYAGTTQGPSFHPDRFGFADPKSLLHASIDLQSPVLTERLVINARGAGQAIRFGPGAQYAASTERTVAGRGYLTTLKTQSVSGCSEGWARIEKDDGQYFPRPPAGALPDGWICIGDGPTTFAEVPRVFAEALANSAPADLYSVEVSGKGTDRLVRGINANYLTDIAVSPTGQFYGVTSNALVRIDTTSGATTTLATFQTGAVGSFTGLLVSTIGRLLIGTSGGYVVEVDTQNPLQGTVVGQFTGFGVWGDLTYGPDGDLYVSAFDAAGGVLLRAHPTTYALRAATRYSGIGAGAVWGLVFSGQQLVGLVWDATASGRLMRIDPVTGAATEVRRLGFGPGGATRKGPVGGVALTGRALSIGERLPVSLR